MQALGSAPSGADAPLVAVLDRIAAVSVELAERIGRGGIDENLGGTAGKNTGGDTQKALDVIADEAFMAALEDGGDIRHYASEEQDGVVTMSREGAYALAIDPLDGSSNIDTNVSIGAIFGIYPAAGKPEESFLRPGSDMVAAGYTIFGPQCALVVTLGDGVLVYVLAPGTGRFHLLDSAPAISTDTNEYAINSSNHRHWGAPVRAYIDDLQAGLDGPVGKNFNMRWVGSLVAETHRILARGGVFLYPGDGRDGYARGRLRYIYECAPIAFLVEQAGGHATDGAKRILDATPDGLHARTPLVFGSSSEVERVAAYNAR